MVQEIPSVPIPPFPQAFVIIIIYLFIFFGKAANDPRWGRAVHPKTPRWSIKKWANAPPGGNTKIVFSIKQAANAVFN